MSSTPAPAGAPFALSTRMLAGSLMGALVFIAIALSFVLPTDETPPVWVPFAQLVAGVGIHAVLEAIGYRAQPLAAGLSQDDATAAGQARWQSGMILRFALSESVAIASIAAAFVLPQGGFMIYAFGGLVSLVLMAVHVWPWSRPVGKAADALEASGQRSHLRETFGVV